MLLYVLSLFIVYNVVLLSGYYNVNLQAERSVYIKILEGLECERILYHIEKRKKEKLTKISENVFLHHIL